MKQAGDARAIHDRAVLKQRTMTSVPGVFAAGEVADGRYRQRAMAAVGGCRAAIDAEGWLEEQV